MEEAAHGNGDPDLSRVYESLSGGAASSSGPGSEKDRRSSRASSGRGYPPIRRVPNGQDWRAQDLEWSQTPGDRRLREEPTRQRDMTQILTFK